MSLAASHRLPVLASFVLSATCGSPVPTGPSPSTPASASAHAPAICRWPHGDVGAGPCTDDQESKPAAARVRRIGVDTDKLAGPLAIGRRGDYLLENEEIVAVIDQLGRGAGFAESGGNFVDLADARVRRDELGQIFTYFGAFPRQAVYDRLETGVEKDGTAWIEVTGTELYERDLVVRTRYALRPGERGVLVRTELENRGARAVLGLELGDAIQWGATEKVAPGKAAGFTGTSSGPYLAGVGTSVAYVVMSSAKDTELSGVSGTAWSNVSYQRGVAIAPGKPIAYERVVAVAPRGDTLGVATERLFRQRGSPGGLEIQTVDPTGAIVPPPAGARVLISPPEGDVVAWWRIGEDATGTRRAGAEVPPGKYVLELTGGGRTSRARTPVEVRAGALAFARIPVSDAGRVRVAVSEASTGEAPVACPAKVQIFAGDPGGERVLPPILGKGEPVEAPLVPGRYRVVASRGPEFSLGEASVEVKPGQTADVALSVARVVDTRGYLACDFHQHTGLSADSGVSMRDRILSNVAEGVECAAQTEHNMVADFMPLVRELGLAAHFRSWPADELTSDASRQPFGHANVFPLEVDPADPRGGAPAVRDRSAREVFAAARALPGGDHVLQINHPRTGRTGYFDQLEFDRRSGVGAAPGYDPTFDAIEIWNGRHVGVERDKVLADYWALLGTMHPVTPTANTDTHGIVGSEAGYPRTYVGVRTDEPSALGAAELVRAIRERRDVVLTNGPFVTLRLGGVRAGSLASLRGRGAVPKPVLAIAVERAPWVDATELVLVVGGVEREIIPLAAPKTTALGALRDDVLVPLTTARPAGPDRVVTAVGEPKPLAIVADTFVVAMVRGKRPLEPVLSGDPAEIAPFAMTAPLWLDADGDGKSLGR